MFYRIIEKKRNEWLNSPECVITDLISYIEHQHKMRDAQIESIKTYLFLKIECANRPLWELFASGKFTTTNVDALEVNKATRAILEQNPAALALWEYASISDDKGNVNSQKILDAIKLAPESIDYVKVIKELFFNVSYPDYLFSIPMGAGKTYLMAAMIYLNLYFAITEPDNPLFAHNFILFVPSGLKSSIVPSLRDIQNFDPLWILPDPVASQLKNLIQYEWLQESSSASKSNLVKNPNARKISMHTANPDLIGLVAVTNAEKVILDRIGNNSAVDEILLRTLSEEERKEYEATKRANELREQIGKIPGLCILIDEVHHASDNQKLRLVVNKWMKQSNFNSVLGFSGTPNMDPALRIRITDDLEIKYTQYANVVTYYPLINGLGNFLKIPVVRYADIDSMEVISNGLQEFFKQYQSRTYDNGALAKIAIYTPSISSLEEEVYPEVCSVCRKLGIEPVEAILKYHKGNTQYKTPADAQFEFSMLDSPLSKKRIILLVGIGREGWNCKSLTGVILSQRNSCPQNMVLQISCRCLREVDNAKRETAIIWLNKFNADKLNKQLQEQQYTTISEFGSHKQDDTVTISWHSRMDKLQLPPIEFCQIKINYNTVETEAVGNISGYLKEYLPPLLGETMIYTQGFDTGNMVSEGETDYGYQENVTFSQWLDLIIKESLGIISIGELKPYGSDLSSVFAKIAFTHDNRNWLNPKIDQKAVRSDIRKCFAAKRSFNVSEELVPEMAKILNIEKTSRTIDVLATDIYVPGQTQVKSIINADEHGGSAISEEEHKMILDLQARGFNIPMPELNDVYNRTYHYLPYHLDSYLEKDYLSDVIGSLGNLPGVEIYFNGDDTMTDFKIRCYEKRGRIWKLLGYYYPDFIILNRNPDKSINKIVIAETKGEGFAAKFMPKRSFMEDMFIRLNNDYYGREKFAFLYIEDTDPKEERLKKTRKLIHEFLLN